MFDIGFSEMVIVGVIALIAIGPKQLPEVARVAGRFLNDMKRMTSEFTHTFMQTRDSANQYLTDAQNQLNKSLSAITDNQTDGHHDPMHSAQESFHFPQDEVTPAPSEPPHPQQLEFDHIEIVDDVPAPVAVPDPAKKDSGSNDT